MSNSVLQGKQQTEFLSYDMPGGGKISFDVAADTTPGKLSIYAKFDDVTFQKSASDGSGDSVPYKTESGDNVALSGVLKVAEVKGKGTVEELIKIVPMLDIIVQGLQEPLDRKLEERDMELTFAQLSDSDKEKLKTEHPKIYAKIEDMEQTFDDLTKREKRQLKEANPEIYDKVMDIGIKDRNELDKFALEEKYGQEFDASYGESSFENRSTFVTQKLETHNTVLRLSNSLHDQIQDFAENDIDNILLNGSTEEEIALSYELSREIGSAVSCSFDIKAFIISEEYQNQWYQQGERMLSSSDTITSNDSIDDIAQKVSKQTTLKYADTITSMLKSNDASSGVASSESDDSSSGILSSINEDPLEYQQDLTDTLDTPTQGNSGGTLLTEENLATHNNTIDDEAQGDKMRQQSTVPIESSIEQPRSVSPIQVNIDTTSPTTRSSSNIDLNELARQAQQGIASRASRTGESDGLQPLEDVPARRLLPPVRRNKASGGDASPPKTATSPPVGKIRRNTTSETLAEAVQKVGAAIDRASSSGNAASPPQESLAPVPPPKGRKL